MFWNFKRHTALTVIICYLFFSLSACMKTVTEYRTEIRPKTVTKYRTVEKPVWKETETPYTEEVKIPQYKVIKRPKLKTQSGAARLAVVPFIPSSDNKKEQGEQAGELVENAIKNHRDTSVRYTLVDHERLSAALNKDIGHFDGEDFKKIARLFNLDYLVSGDIKQWTSDLIAINLEAFDLDKMIPVFAQEFKGTPEDITKKIIEVFFGKKVSNGFKTESVTRYKKEKKMVTEVVKEPYQETVYEEEQVPYEAKKVDWFSTLFWVVIAIVSASSSKKDE